MAIPVYLQQFQKVSGVYSVEFDRSQIPQNTLNILRLIIGFSKKGPVNTPVFCPNAQFFKDVFGDVDKKLERRGSFFHSSCLTALERGPILAMNLLITDDNLDRTEFRPMSLSATIQNGSIANAPLSEYYNTDKFWFYDPEQLQNIVRDYHPILQDSLFTIGNVARKDISVIIRKPSNSGRTGLGLDVLAKEWYLNSDEGVPEFMDENDYISDYLLEVVVFEGKFEDYSQLQLDPLLGNFFDSQGLKKTIVDGFGNERDGLEEFINSGLVTVLGRYTGVTIPDFIDKNGTNLYIADLVNNDTYLTGLQMYLNENAFDDEFLSGDQIDLIGHTVESEQPSTIDFLSYFGTVNEFLTYEENQTIDLDTFELIAADSTVIPNTVNGYLQASTALTSLTTYVANRYDTLVILGPNHPDVIGGNATSFFATQQDFDAYVETVALDKTFVVDVLNEDNASVPSFVGTKSHIVERIVSSVNTTSIANDLLQIRFALEDEITGGSRVALDQYYYLEVALNSTLDVDVIAQMDQLYHDGGVTSELIALQWSETYQNAIDGILTNGDETLISTGPDIYNPITFTYQQANDFTALGILNSDGFSKNIGYVEVKAFTDDTFVTQISIPTLATLGATERTFKTLQGNLNETFEILSQPDATTIILDNSASGPFGFDGFNGKVLVGDFLVRSFNSGVDEIDPRTGKSRLTRVISVTEDRNPLSATYKQITVKAIDPIFVDNTNSVERYKLIENFASHYRFTALDGYVLRQEQLPNDTNERMNEIYDVMYDTNIASALTDVDNINFRYIVDTFNHGIEPNSKARLARIALKRENTFAILNAPSVDELKKSTNPYFKATPISNFDPFYIGTGGNLDLNPTNIWTLPSVEEGANYCAFFGPNLLIRENGRNISRPPASFISNKFIDKFFQALPYSIVAGPRRGTVSGTGLVGLEYNFTREQLSQAEPWGYNSILNENGIGLVINSNQTAQQTIKSALSQIHAREVLIFIKEGVKNILRNYRWEFNTAQNRLEIKNQVDSFIGTVLNNGGLNSFDTIMDTRNNTNEIIDNNLGIIDIFVEPVRGFGTLVARYTILSTGSISAGDFQLPT